MNEQVVVEDAARPHCVVDLKCEPFKGRQIRVLSFRLRGLAAAVGYLRKVGALDLLRSLMDSTAKDQVETGLNLLSFAPDLLIEVLPHQGVWHKVNKSVSRVVAGNLDITDALSVVTALMSFVSSELVEKVKNVASLPGIVPVGPSPEDGSQKP